MLAFSCDPNVPSIPPFCRLLFTRSVPLTYTKLFPSAFMGSCPAQRNFPQIWLLRYIYLQIHTSLLWTATSAINQPNADETHGVLLPWLQRPSPTFISVVHVCGHTLKLITWNLSTCCLSQAWPQPPVLPPLLTQQSLWAAHVMTYHQPLLLHSRLVQPCTH